MLRSVIAKKLSAVVAIVGAAAQLSPRSCRVQSVNQNASCIRRGMRKRPYEFGMGSEGVYRMCAKTLASRF
jgi:hypothetical protein